MKICLSCGAVAPVNNADCGRCNAVFEGNTAKTSPRADGLVFARVQGHFKCRSCGKNVAINHLESTESVMCGSCGVDQSLELRQWKDIVNHVHSTADITGDSKPLEGDPFWKFFDRDEGSSTGEKYRSIGYESSTLTSSGGVLRGAQWEVDASPGHPVCTKCRKLLDIGLHEKKLTTSCPSCHRTATYGLPESSINYEGLAGAITPEHCVDHPNVKTNQSSGGAAISLVCPNCSGALTSSEPGRVTVCEFCDTHCHIPASVWQRAKGKAIAPEPWWMLFDRPSKQRTAVEQLQSRDQKRKERALEKRRRDREERLEQEAIQAKAKRRIIVGVTIGVGVLAAVCAIFVALAS